MNCWMRINIQDHQKQVIFIDENFVSSHLKLGRGLKKYFLDNTITINLYLLVLHCMIQSCYNNMRWCRKSIKIPLEEITFESENHNSSKEQINKKVNPIRTNAYYTLFNLRIFPRKYKHTRLQWSTERWTGKFAT